MAELENVMEAGFAQSEIIVIPIIDVSGSMGGERIGMVNDAMSEVPEQLNAINDGLIDTRLLIAPMEFSSGASWFQLHNGEPAEVDTFVWRDMQASGLTDMGEAFKLLTEKLTVKEKGGWMSGRGGMAPILILISDGGPTDNYKPQLEILKKRGWFRAAHKFAVAVGDADKEVLKEFCGFDEAVIDTNVIRNNLSSIIKAVVVTASSCVSQSASTVSGGNRPQTVVDDCPDVNEENQKEVIQAVTDELITMDNTDDLF